MGDAFLKHGKSRVGGAIPAIQSGAAPSSAAALFLLGLVVGIAATRLQAREIATVMVFLVLAAGTVFLLRKLAGRSDRHLLTPDFAYREFFDNAIEGIFRTTPDGHYLDVNPALARIYGYDSPEEMKAGLTDISSQLYVDSRRRDEFQALMAQHDQVSDFVSEIHRRDGTTIWIKENARAVRDWSGKLICYQGTVEDVTAKFEAERAIKRGLKRAEEANATKNAFLAMMSHELKTPLNAILGFSDMVRREMLGPIGTAAYRGYMNDIYNSGVRLLAIINDVLDVARLEGAAITLNRQLALPQDVAETALDRARHLTGTAQAVTIDIPSDMPSLHVDQNRLSQVLANLLCNALKFTPEGGEIRLSAAFQKDGGVHFEVCDSGIGMSEETIALVLQPFHQADASLARRFEGAGLGLPIAHALTELHGGRLAIRSAEHKGTTVTIELPPSCVWSDENLREYRAAIA
nr:PAS domain-containing sensor histidine kinase [Rhizomicrobium palustre]